MRADNLGVNRSRTLSVISAAILAAAAIATMVAVSSATFIASAASIASTTPPSVDSQLDAFKAWLDRTRPGYGCDEGPARFRNSAVEAAYPGRRFYYVLTYARGIQPPFENSVTMVAEVNDQGQVRPLRRVEELRVGLMKVSSAKSARLAAAAVMALGSCGERRWNYSPESFTARRKGGGWVCSYEHGTRYYLSHVTFDRKGLLTAMSNGAPPVP